MRIQNSFAAAVAAAVAAVVFSAAFQPAEAAIITIDNFSDTSSNSAGPLSGTGALQTLVGAGNTPTGSIFDTRFSSLQFQQTGGSGTRRAAAFSGTASTTGGIGLFVITKGTNANPSFPTIGMFTAMEWSNSNSSSVDLSSAGSNDAFQLVISAFQRTSGTNVVTPGTTQLEVIDNFANSVSAPLTLATGTTTIPFTSFTGANPVDWSQITSVTYRSIWQTFNTFNGAATNSVSFDSILVVPEPSQMVFMAGAGAVLGAWRLRKLRRDRPAAGDATAG